MSVKKSFQDFAKQIHASRISEGTSVLNFDFNKTRCRVLTKNEQVKPNGSGVLYWITRDCRVQDNWAMLFAQRMALKNKVPLHGIFFMKDTKDLYPSERQLNFLLEGLRQVRNECEKLNITFHLVNESPLVLPTLVNTNDISCIVTDFSPLKTHTNWHKEVMNELSEDVPLVVVDAHNIVPCWIASDKQEIAARTIRPKITKKLEEYLTGFPQLSLHPHSGKLDLSKLKIQDMTAIDNVSTWAQPGEEEGLKTLHKFVRDKLHLYGDYNDPSKDTTSNLSPWLHFGQISAQRCALTVSELKQKHKAQCEKFLEELIIRKELSDNFCYYNDKYDQFEGADGWAKKTLNEHRKDKRQYLYTREQFEQAQTHDEIWNCAQTQLLRDGKIHSYMRMYWCKKILEWTQSVEEAIDFGLYLNDTYSLDGCDPNGYVGVMWSICGIHDHGWKERDIFGKIRYMVDYSLRKKFDIDSYCSKYLKDYKPPKKTAPKRKHSKVE